MSQSAVIGMFASSARVFLGHVARMLHLHQPDEECRRAGAVHAPLLRGVHHQLSPQQHHLSAVSVMGQYRSHLIDEIINAAPASAADQTFDHLVAVLEAAESTEIQMALEESHRVTRNQAADEMERLRREEERNKYELREIERRSSELVAYERKEGERRRRQREEWEALEVPKSSLAMSLECSICTNQMKTAVALVPCMHHYCKECITNCLLNNTTCPLCRQPVMGQYRSHLIDEIISAAPVSAANQTFDHLVAVLEAAESTEIQMALEESHRATRNQAADEMERLRREEERNKYELREIERRSSELAAYERKERQRRRRQREEWEALEVSRRHAEKKQFDRSEEERRHREKMEWDKAKVAEMSRRHAEKEQFDLSEEGRRNREMEWERTVMSLRVAEEQFDRSEEERRRRAEMSRRLAKKKKLDRSEEERRHREMEWDRAEMEWDRAEMARRVALPLQPANPQATPQ